jgi:hypothetical protein
VDSYGPKPSEYINAGGTSDNDVMGKAGNTVGMVGKVSPKAADALGNYSEDHGKSGKISGSAFLNVPTGAERSTDLTRGCQEIEDKDF